MINVRHKLLLLLLFMNCISVILISIFLFELCLFKLTYVVLKSKSTITALKLEKAKSLTLSVILQFPERPCFLVMSLASPNSATFTSWGNLCTMIFLSARSQCSIWWSHKSMYHTIMSYVAWRKYRWSSSKSQVPFWSADGPWPVLCGKVQWWRGAGDFHLCTDFLYSF